MVSRQGCVGHLAHQSDVAATIDQLPASTADLLPDHARGLRILGSHAVP
jgi:hypothetical protein